MIRRRTFGDIRVTFDKNLMTYNSQCDLFHLSEVVNTSVFLDNMQIMEVKFRLPLPTYVSKVLSLVPLVRCRISKYVLCQRFSDYTKWRDELTPPF
jgi:hypothetical protein